MINTATKIQHVESNFEILNSIEVDLEKLLVEEFSLGFANDLDNPGV